MDTHICTRTHMYVYTRTHMYVYTWPHMCVYTHGHTHMYTQRHMCICKPTRAHIYVDTYICIHARTRMLTDMLLQHCMLRINIQDSDSQNCQIQSQPRKPKSCLLLHTHKGRETFSHISRRRLMLVSQSCPTFCDPMDYSPPGFSVHGIFQARILEWVAFPFSRVSSNPGIKPGSPALQAASLPSESPGKTLRLLIVLLKTKICIWVNCIDQERSLK